jgi:hypothetical protein
MAEDDMLKSELAKAAKEKAKMEKMIAEQQQYLQYLREQQQELRASAPREKGNAAQKPTVQTRSVSTSPLQITHNTSPQKDTFSIDSPSAMPAPASKTASPGSSLGSQSKQSSPAALAESMTVTKELAVYISYEKTNLQSGAYPGLSALLLRSDGSLKQAGDTIERPELANTFTMVHIA